MKRLVLMVRASVVLSATVSAFGVRTAAAQATTAFLTLRDGNTVVKGYAITTGHQDDFEILGMSASPANAGGPLTLHLTLSLDGAPGVIAALDRGTNLSFDIGITHTGPDVAKPTVTTLKAQHALVTSYAFTAVSGKAYRAQVTLTAQQTTLVSATGTTVSTPLPTIVATATPNAATTIRGNPIRTLRTGAIAQSDNPSAGATAGIAVDSLTFQLVRASITSVSMISQMHFTTHADNALALLTEVATRGDSINGSRFQLYGPDPKGLVQSQSVLVIQLYSAAFPGTANSTGSGAGAARGDTRPVTPGSYNISIAPAVAAPGHVLQIQQPVHATTTTVH